MSELININGRMSEAQTEAVKLHQSIMLNAELAANSIVAMCRDLKTMRDRRLYEELGCSEFGEYTEKLVGIKARQAYTYISTYEKLGDTVLQSNANLGITKLSMIAQLNSEDRVEMLESGKADEMTVSELKRLVEENKNQGEQISMLTAEIEQLKQNEEATEENSEFEETITQLKSQLEEKNALVDKLEKAEAEKKRAYSEGEKSAQAAANQKIDLLNSQIEAAKLHSQELEKQLALSDSTSAEAKVYIFSIQAEFNSLMTVIGKMPPEQGEKFKGAVKKLCNAISDRC